MIDTGLSSMPRVAGPVLETGLQIGQDRVKFSFQEPAQNPVLRLYHCWLDKSEKNNENGLF